MLAINAAVLPAVVVVVRLWRRTQARSRSDAVGGGACCCGGGRRDVLDTASEYYSRPRVVCSAE
ncbi:hypothetical protein ABZX40_14990 [Streptomyces sp. NPDC004610]|uniref:hypothetical protein n=1 Tax=unclassified Streptomyces TaxID=2593676 RepID=UPI00339FD15C